MQIPIGGSIDRKTGKVTLVRQEVDPAEVDRIVKALISASKLTQAKEQASA